MQISPLPLAEQLQTRVTDHASRFAQAMARRIEEIKQDDCAHHGMYAMLGVSAEEGHMLDLHQNKSRFLYRYAGSLTEKSVVVCFKSLDPFAGPLVIPNTRGARPKTVQIDCRLGQEAFEIKWRDATTDGDHAAKERMKVQVIADAGFVPIKLAFFEPQRAQAQKIQASLAQLFEEQGGHYYAGPAAWDYVRERTGVDLWAQLRSFGDMEVVPKLDEPSFNRDEQAPELLLHAHPKNQMQLEMALM